MPGLPLCESDTTDGTYGMLPHSATRANDKAYLSSRTRPVVITQKTGPMR